MYVIASLVVSVSQEPCSGCSKTAGRISQQQLILICKMMRESQQRYADGSLVGATEPLLPVSAGANGDSGSTWSQIQRPENNDANPSCCIYSSFDSLMATAQHLPYVLIRWAWHLAEQHICELTNVQRCGGLI